MEQVYIFDFGDRIKVGYSTNVKRRLRTIELSSGQKAKNVFVVNGGKDIEFLAHAWLTNRLEGEFFAHPYTDAVELVQKISVGEITKPPFQPKRAQEQGGFMYNPPDVVISIKKMAKTKNIPIKDMLSGVGLGINTLSHMNHGKAIAFDSLARIADYLDCSVDYLLGRTDNPEVNRTCEEVKPS